MSNHPTQVFSNETGDIVIGGGNTKPKNKIILLVIVAIVLLLIVVVALVAATLGTQDSKLTKTDTAFVSYSNYLYFGNDEATANTGKISFYNTFAYKALSQDSNKRKEFIRQAIEKFNTFAEHGKQYESLNGSIAAAIDQLAVAEAYAETGATTSIDMMILLGKSGEAELNEAVMTKYGSLLEGDSDLLASFAQHEIALAEAVVAGDMAGTSVFENEINECFRQIVMNLINGCRNIKSILTEGTQ